MTPIAGPATAGWTIDAIVDGEGTCTCVHAAALRVPDAATRDLSDAVHAWCALHGAAPSLVDQASRANGAAPVAGWLQEAGAAFDGERQKLVTLTAAIGPIPSTPRHAQAQAAMDAQRHALATLASSDRAGCALGAALALLIDWHAVDRVLAAAAERAGLGWDHSDLPSRAAITAVAQRIAANPAHARALGFGAQQLVLQHRGLWQLLAARAGARDAR